MIKICYHTCFHLSHNQMIQMYLTSCVLDLTTARDLLAFLHILCHCFTLTRKQGSSKAFEKGQKLINTNEQKIIVMVTQMPHIYFGLCEIAE